MASVDEDECIILSSSGKAEDLLDDSILIVEENLPSKEEEGTLEVVDEEVMVTFCKKAKLMPHARHDCTSIPFERKECAIFGPLRRNAETCGECYCYICNKQATECKYWLTKWMYHCNAHNKCQYWKSMRNFVLTKGSAASNVGPSKIDPNVQSGENLPSKEEEGTLEVVDEEVMVTFCKKAKLMPHARHDCTSIPFERKECAIFGPLRRNAETCGECYCYICNKQATECKYWLTKWMYHCNAHNKCQYWKSMRNFVLTKGSAASNVGPSKIDPNVQSGENLPSKEEEGTLEVVDEEEVMVTFCKKAKLMPHARHDCTSIPFERKECAIFGPLRRNAETCGECYCYICNKQATECKFWVTYWMCHCNAYNESEYWKAQLNFALTSGLAALNVGLYKTDADVQSGVFIRLFRLTRKPVTEEEPNGAQASAASRVTSPTSTSATSLASLPSAAAAATPLPPTGIPHKTSSPVAKEHPVSQVSNISRTASASISNLSEAGSLKKGERELKMGDRVMSGLQELWNSLLRSDQFEGRVLRRCQSEAHLLKYVFSLVEDKFQITSDHVVHIAGIVSTDKSYHLEFNVNRKYAAVVRFLGKTDFAEGEWCGLEMDEPKGKNDGAVAGRRYFQCQPKHGLFVLVQAMTEIGFPSVTSAKAKTTAREAIPTPTVASSVSSKPSHTGVGASSREKAISLVSTNRACEEDGSESRGSPDDRRDRLVREKAVKKKPRLFCDICEYFDLHDTEDCLIQETSNCDEYETF